MSEKQRLRAGDEIRFYNHMRSGLVEGLVVRIHPDPNAEYAVDTNVICSIEPYNQLKLLKSNIDGEMVDNTK
jgi:hypothetical protein